METVPCSHVHHILCPQSIQYKGCEQVTQEHGVGNAAAVGAISSALLLSLLSPAFVDSAANAAPAHLSDACTRSLAAVPGFLPNVSNLFPAPGTTTSNTNDVGEGLTDDERATVSIFDRNTPSVVNIANLAAYSRR
jgi:hypothetical protein